MLRVTPQYVEPCKLVPVTISLFPWPGNDDALHHTSLVVCLLYQTRKNRELHQGLKKTRAGSQQCWPIFLFTDLFSGCACWAMRKKRSHASLYCPGRLPTHYKKLRNNGVETRIQLEWEKVTFNMLTESNHLRNLCFLNAFLNKTWLIQRGFRFAWSLLMLFKHCWFYVKLPLARSITEHLL